LVSQHILPLAFGSGGNGKSTIPNVILGLLGDYGTTANYELLLPAK
jgi:phage/plasmid-associated DNA primase